MNKNLYSYRHYPNVLLLFLGILVFYYGLGCGGGNGDSAEYARFGDPYQIMSNETPSSPDRPPHLQGDTLIAWITYTGGCESHDFMLEYFSNPDTSRIWVNHDAGGDECEAQIQDSLEVLVPGEALQTKTVMLLNPNGGPPFILRWGN